MEAHQELFIQGVNRFPDSMVPPLRSQPAPRQCARPGASIGLLFQPDGNRVAILRFPFKTLVSKTF